MSVDLMVVCIQVVVQDVDFVSENMSNMSPVVTIVNPSVISGSVVGNLHVQGVGGNSVSVQSHLVAVVGNSVVSDPLSLVVNLDIQIVNQLAVDMN